MQKTNFDFEIVIGEDFSTDRTRDIAIEYAAKHPTKIKLILDNKNVGGHINFIRTLNACKGEFIALLDGDDYWTSPYKLQKQVDLLSKRQDCVICFHNVLEMFEDTTRPPFHYCPSSQKETSTLEDLLRSNFMATCSVVFRNNLFENYPEWYLNLKLKMGDWPFHILNAQYGNICYINEVMGVHRIHQGGTWHSKSLTNQLLEIIEAYKFYYSFFQSNLLYRKIIQDTVRNHFFTIAKEYEKIGNLEDANIYFKKAKSEVLFENSIEANSGTPEIIFDRIIDLVRRGQIDKAIEIFKNLLASMPENQEAQQLLKQLSQTNTIGENIMQSTFNYGRNFFGPVILNPGTLARIASDSATWQEILAFHSLLATDEYVKYLDAFYRECIKRFGSNWYYIDIVNVLYAASRTIQPRMYLEIGVRRGRSVCTVARGCPNVSILAFDMWLPGYAGMENPGPEFVKSELQKHGYTGEIFFINGDSHQTVPAFFRQNPQAMFDMITVDGDHSEEGALDDLRNVIPHLSVGGILVFDDITHPAHPYLLNVWKKTMAMFPFLTSFEFTEMGYGVAFAIRKSE